MRRVVVLAFTIASSIGCKSLSFQEETPECTSGGTCRGRSSDSGVQADLAPTVVCTEIPHDASGPIVGPSVCTSNATGGIVCRPVVAGNCDVRPAAPTGIVVTIGDKQLVLSWTAVPGATQYRVSRNATATGTFSQMGLTTTTSYLDKPLANGDTYYYVVAAGIGSCWSADSAVTPGTPSETTPPAEPNPPPGCVQTPPTNVQASPSGSVRVTLTWTAATSEPTLYSISRSTISGSGYQFIGSAAGAMTSYVDADANLVKDTRYYYQVTAHSNCAATSPEVSAVTACLTPETPPAPTVSNSNGAMTVTWPAVSDAVAYTVYRDTNPAGSFDTVVSTSQTALTYTDDAGNLGNGRTYYYRLSATNAAGQCISALSESGSAISCAPPDVPTGLRASLRGLRQVELTWSASEGASQYSVLRGTISGAEVDITPPGARISTTSFIDTGLTDGITYYYQVRAHNGAYNACSSAPSAEVKATPTGCVVLSGSQSNYMANTTRAYCFVTCWDFPAGVPGVGMNVGNFGGRTFTINGQPINCSPNCILPSDLTKDYSTFTTTGAFVFRVTAGSNMSAVHSWWSTRPGRDCQ